MKKIKKFISSILIIVLILVGAVLFALGYSAKWQSDLLSYLEYYQVQVGLVVVAAILIIGAIMLLIDYVDKSNHSEVYLKEDEEGSILLSKKSLESSVRDATNSVRNVDFTKAKIKLVGEDTVKVTVYADVFQKEGLDVLALDIKESISQAIRDMIGIEDVRVDVHMNKTQRASNEEIRY